MFSFIGSVVDHTYMSFNWTDFKQIFYIGEIHSHCGKQVIPRLKKALEKLKKEGYGNFKTTVSQKPKEVETTENFKQFFI